MKYREIGDKFDVSASSASEKLNTVGTDKNLFRLVGIRLVPVPGYSARVLPLELVPVPGYNARVLPLELVPVPVPCPWGHGTQISARIPTKGYVQTGDRARAPSLNRP